MRTKEKPLWVKARMVMERTGWTKYDMHSARNNNWINWKHDSTGFWYDLRSIAPEFLKTEAYV